MPGRYLVVLSSGQQLIVGVQALADAGATRVGVVLSDEQVGRLLHAGAVTTLVDRALGFLARGRKTRRELEVRLGRRPREGDAPAKELIAEALDRLEASGVLSDADAARAEASSRLRRGEAPGKVRQSLRRKGIDGRQTDQAIADAVEHDGFDELEACREQATKRWRSLASLEPAVGRRRLVAFLQRRGFGGGVIRTVLTQITKGDVEAD